jgi:hypothetical protein
MIRILPSPTRRFPLVYLGLLTGCLFASALPGAAQVGIGTTTPLANSALELSSTTRGFTMPRMTGTQRNALQATLANNPIYAGTQVYVTDEFAVNTYGSLDGGSTYQFYPPLAAGLTLPFSQNASLAVAAFAITNVGAGGAGRFVVNNAAATGTALTGVTNASSGASGVFGQTTNAGGTSLAGVTGFTNAGGNSSGVIGENTNPTGVGAGVSGRANSVGATGGFFDNQGSAAYYALTIGQGRVGIGTGLPVVPADTLGRLHVKGAIYAANVGTTAQGYVGAQSALYVGVGLGGGGNGPGARFFGTGQLNMTGFGERINFVDGFNKRIVVADATNLLISNQESGGTAATVTSISTGSGVGGRFQVTNFGGSTLFRVSTEASPTYRAEVFGVLRATGVSLSTGSFTGAVLTSDALGNGSWQDAPLPPIKEAEFASSYPISTGGLYLYNPGGPILTVTPARNGTLLVRLNVDFSFNISLPSQIVIGVYRSTSVTNPTTTTAFSFARVAGFATPPTGGGFGDMIVEISDTFPVIAGTTYYFWVGSRGLNAGGGTGSLDNPKLTATLHSPTGL